MRYDEIRAKLVRIQHKEVKDTKKGDELDKLLASGRRKAGARKAAAFIVETRKRADAAKPEWEYISETVLAAALAELQVPRLGAAGEHQGLGDVLRSGCTDRSDPAEKDGSLFPEERAGPRGARVSHAAGRAVTLFYVRDKSLLSREKKRWMERREHEGGSSKKANRGFTRR